MIVELGLSLTSFAAFAMAAVAVFRIVYVKNVMYALVATFVAVLTTTTVFATMFLRDLDFWVFFSLFLCLFLIFVQVFSIFYKSISLRLVFDIHVQQGDRATLNWVYGASILAGSFQRRLLALEEGKLISKQCDMVVLTPKGFRMALKLIAVQNAFGITNSG